MLNGCFLNNQQLPIIKDQDYLPLHEEYFKLDSLIFRDLKSRSATLKNRKTGRAIRVNFPDDENFLIWHKPNAPYICLEPWSGLPDIVGSSYDISKKEWVLKGNLTYADNNMPGANTFFTCIEK